MNNKSKLYKNARRLIYFCLFATIIAAFVYLSKKYEPLSEEKTINFSSYYKDINTDKYNIINAGTLLKELKNGKYIVFVGNHESKWSEAYAYILTECLEELNIRINYYDLYSDKNQKNSNYYKIRERLKNYLVSTDDSDNNLLAPSLYIVDKGKIEYYNIATVAVKNNTRVEEYWTNYNRESFKREIKNNIKRYYLNN